MVTSGIYTVRDTRYGVVLNHTKKDIEIILVSNGKVSSAYKTEGKDEYSYISNDAKELWSLIREGIRSCRAKDAVSVPFVLGTSLRHEFITNKNEYIIEMYNGELCLLGIQGEDFNINLEYDTQEKKIPTNIPYIKLTKANYDLAMTSDVDSVPIRSVEEIALGKKDTSWLKNKHYYIVNDDEKAEKLFEFLDNYNKPIAYDTETSGLKINCFGKINSEYQRNLEKWNQEHPDEMVRADYLVGIIFCVQPNVSYYFPVGNRRFKNLYSDKDSKIRKKIIANTKARYTIGDLKDSDSDMADYVRNTPEDEFSSDVILMERVRDILQTKHIVAHNGAFEWKVGWQYEVDTNLKDDTMILHQIMYKFRSTTRNSGEPSNLKHLALVELGIEQWDLGDFFPTYSDKDDGKVRSDGSKKKKKRGKYNSNIDFSYMDYKGTQIYAPTDGDVTLHLYHKYKKDMIENHKEQEYLYNVEIIVACAVGYMEFYGHRIDEAKISYARNITLAESAIIQSKIRQEIKYSSEEEIAKFHELNEVFIKCKDLDKKGDLAERDKVMAELIEKTKLLEQTIEANTDKIINLGSPAQMCRLFYDDLEIPCPTDKPSVDKKSLKQLLKLKDENGNVKYKVVELFSAYKNLDTLLTKFFDNLPEFMYPGGYIFTSYGQISTATGRMSAKQPNAQQYPKVVTNIVTPREDYLMIDADYSQIEYRVLVALAGEEHLASLFSDPDSDYHTLMASLMYGVPYASVTPKMRSDAKSFNFGIPYGMGFRSLAILLTGLSGQAQIEEAKEKYELYFKDQPKTKKLFHNIKEGAQVNGYTKTLWNRYRYYSFTDKDGNISEKKKAMALRQAGNAVIQGCLHGDTRIQTKEFGIVKIKDVVDNHLMVWDGDKWSNGDILYSGKKKKCTVKFSNGQQIICSPIHKFLVVSHKGNKRFVECKDLLTKENSKNAHRVVINQKYEQSDFKYNSSDAYKYKGLSHNSRNVFLEDIGNSFDIGVVLGRLASDGSILNREDGAKCITQYVAESEFNILPELRRCMEALQFTESDNKVREGRNEIVNRISVYSKSLTNEVESLDIKHKVHDNIFMDTELLRGFLRGFFDGDGGISGKTINLVFGTQHNFDTMCRDIQKALLFMGIRSRYRKYDDRYVLAIKTNDNKKFLDTIGFINENKQKSGYELECITDEHIFGPSLVVESVEITDEYIDMYDVCNTDGGYYVADGVITHNTAADIFKISVARNFNYIRQNKLFGLLLIINMVHDEQLFEINTKKLNAKRILRDIGINMQFKLKGFPPLYIGAGVGTTWAQAKDKMAEIHPHLLDKLSEESENTPIYTDTPSNPQEELDFMAKKIYQFRVDKVKEYLLDSNNYNVDLHPAIGNLLNLQFSYGHDKKAEKLEDNEFTFICLSEFIKHNNLDIDPNLFKVQVAKIEEEEEDGYDEDEDDLELDGDMEFGYSSFALVDESNVTFGSSIQDLIKTFGCMVSKAKKVCGIDTHTLSFKQRNEIIEYISEHVCEPTDEGAMQVMFLKDGGVLERTPVWVNNISGSEVETRLKLAEKKLKEESTGTIEDRLKG